MLRSWQLQDAKARFSELVKRATTEGPQVVTCRGVKAVVVLSMAEYHRLEAGRPSLVDYLLAGPQLNEEDVALINDRPSDTGRDLDL